MSGEPDGEALGQFGLPCPADPHEAFIKTYSAVDSDSGIGKPSSLSPSICNLIASYMLASTSSLISPVAKHPVRSGEYAEKFPGARSITTRNLYMLSTPSLRQIRLAIPLQNGLAHPIAQVDAGVPAGALGMDGGTHGHRHLAATDQPFAAS